MMHYVKAFLQGVMAAIIGAGVGIAIGAVLRWIL